MKPGSFSLQGLTPWAQKKVKNERKMNSIGQRKNNKQNYHRHLSLLLKKKDRRVFSGRGALLEKERHIKSMLLMLMWDLLREKKNDYF